MPVPTLSFWPVGLARRPQEAKAFYGTIAAATLLGVALNFTPLDPIKALYAAAVLNGEFQKSATERFQTEGVRL